jgi:hypothetical protein
MDGRGTKPRKQVVSPRVGLGTTIDWVTFNPKGGRGRGSVKTNRWDHQNRAHCPGMNPGIGVSVFWGSL